MPRTTSEFIGYAIYLVVCGFALARGGRSERFMVENRVRLQAPQLGMLAVDIVILAAFLALVMRSGARWPLWAAAFQLDATVTHLVKLIDPTVMGWAYLSAIVFWGYAVLASLLVGTIQVMRHPAAALA